MLVKRMRGHSLQTSAPVSELNLSVKYLSCKRIQELSLEEATQAAIQKDVKTFHTVLETVSIAVASLVFVHGPYAIVCWLLSVPATGCVYQGRISSDNFLHASPLR